MRLRTVYLVNNPLVAFIVAKDISKKISRRRILVIETRNFSDFKFNYNCRKIRIKEKLFVRLSFLLSFVLRGFTIEELVIPWLFKVPQIILKNSNVLELSYVEEGTLTRVIGLDLIALTYSEFIPEKHRFTRDYKRLLCLFEPSTSFQGHRIEYFSVSIFRLPGYKVKTRPGDRIGLFPAPHRIPEGEIFASIVKFIEDCNLTQVKLHPVYNNSRSLFKSIRIWAELNPSIKLAPFDMLIESECCFNQITVIGHQSSLALIVESLGSQFIEYEFKNYLG